MHGLVLGLITDIGGLDYRIGFILATGLQVALSYSGNQRFVFK
jgi:putative flippase GtrA